MSIKTRVVAAFLIVTLLLLFTAACKDNPAEESNSEEIGISTGSGIGIGLPDQNFIYLPEFFSIPVDSNSIYVYAFTDDKVYFSTTYILNDEDYLYTAKIYSMDLEGLNVSELTAYAPVVTGAEYGGVNIQAMTVDDDVNIWINEYAWLNNFNLPDNFDKEVHDKYEYVEEADSYNRLIKLDGSGNTLLTIDMNPFLSDEYDWISSIKTDGEGNVYVNISRVNEGIIAIFASDGTYRCSINVSGHSNSLIKLSDGTMAYASYSSRNFEFSLRKIDMEEQSIGEKIELPDMARNVFSGSSRFLYLFSDDFDLYGVDSNSGDAVHLINWIDSNVNVSYGDYRDITMLPDERIATITSQRVGSGATLVIFSKVHRTELPEQTVLTLAVFGLSQTLQEAVVLFNSTNIKYRIQVVDYYGEFSSDDDWRAGLNKLSTEIITGNAPDIISIGNLPISQYAARGLLEDLYTFIDNDPEFSRSDFLETAFHTAEINGSLYQIFPTFTIETLIGNPRVLGYEPGWNIEEFMAVLEANPEADFPMGQWFTGRSFLNSIIMFNFDDYVNWDDGTVNFETDEFIGLLELAKTLPADVTNNHVEEDEAIATGRQIMMQTYFHSYDAIQIQRALFGGEIVFKGYPTNSRQGSTMSIYDGLAITTGCIDKEGAWEFIRTLLSAEWQNTLWYGFPTNKTAFDEKQREAMEYYGWDSTWSWGNITITIEPTTQEEADQIYALIVSLGGTFNYDAALLNIVHEGIDDYFAGRNNAQDTARIIQNRASIYVSEQSG